MRECSTGTVLIPAGLYKRDGSRGIIDSIFACCKASRSLSALLCLLFSFSLGRAVMRDGMDGWMDRLEECCDNVAGKIGRENHGTNQ